MIPQTFYEEEDLKQMENEKRQKELQTMIENLGHILMHPIVGSLFKYKEVVVRSFRMTFLQSRYFTTLLFAGVMSVRVSSSFYESYRP